MATSVASPPEPPREHGAGGVRPTYQGPAGDDTARPTTIEWYPVNPLLPPLTVLERQSRWACEWWPPT